MHRKQVRASYDLGMAKVTLETTDRLPLLLLVSLQRQALQVSAPLWYGC